MRSSPEPPPVSSPSIEASIKECGPPSLRLITVNVLPGNFSDHELSRQKPIDPRLLVRRHKQEYPTASSPVPLQIRIAQINLGRIRKGRTEPHRSSASLHQIDGPPQI